MTTKTRKFYKRIIAVKNGKVEMICEVPNRQTYHMMLKDTKLWCSPGEIIIDTPKRPLTDTMKL